MRCPQEPRSRSRLAFQLLELLPLIEQAGVHFLTVVSRNDSISSTSGVFAAGGTVCARTHVGQVPQNTPSLRSRSTFQSGLMTLDHFTRIDLGRTPASASPGSITSSL